MTSLVSILVPVYNRESIIAETLNAALAQTYQPIEVIVVDNASTDNTWQIIQSFAEGDPRVKAYKNESNIGPVHNWKVCVDRASGEYGKILWSDDLIAPDFLKKTVPLMTSDVGFVFSAAKIFSTIPDAGQMNYMIGKTGIYSSLQFIEGALFDESYPVSPGCALFRLSDLKKNLLVDVPNKVGSDFAMHAIGNDLLIFLLTASQYPKFGFVAEPLAFFRAHQGSISVSSKGGRLPLHYSLVKAFYVENHLPRLCTRLAARIQCQLIVYRNSVPFGQGNIDDFFVCSVSIGWLEFALCSANWFLKLPSRAARKIVKTITKGPQ